ncbi:hypothetical protein [Brevibacterium koreense]
MGYEVSDRRRNPQAIEDAYSQAG